jgi:hypothetical protein
MNLGTGDLLAIAKAWKLSTKQKISPALHLNVEVAIALVCFNYDLRLNLTFDF